MNSDMMAAANKLASDELHHIKDAEIAELRRQNADLIRRLESDTAEIEIVRGKVVFVRGNDPRRNPPELAAGKTPAPTGARVG